MLSVPPARRAETPSVFCAVPFLALGTMPGTQQVLNKHLQNEGRAQGQSPQSCSRWGSNSGLTKDVSEQGCLITCHPTWSCTYHHPPENWQQLPGTPRPRACCCAPRSACRLVHQCLKKHPQVEVSGTPTLAQALCPDALAVEGME